jgi:tryptophan synthase beta chain
VAPTLSLLIEDKVVEWREYSEREIFEAAKIFAETQGIVPAPESAHAIKAVIDLAREAKKNKERITIAFNLSGHGLLDLTNYQDMMVRYS